MPVNADETELGVIVALPAETAAFDAACIDRHAVIAAGIGSGRAEAAAVQALERGARRLLSFGLCGGLTSQLRRGDLLLPRRIVAREGEWATGGAWRAQWSNALQDAHDIDALYCSDVPVTSLDGKRELAARGFAAVDMESAGVARAAVQAGVPFVVLKAVCDPASRAVPAVALRMLDAAGQPRAAAIFDAVFAGPRAWRDLLALRCDFAAALASLRRAARNLPLSAQTIAP